MSHRSTFSQQSGSLLLDDGVPDNVKEALTRKWEMDELVAEAQEKLDLCIAKEQSYEQDVTYHENRLNDKYGAKLNKLGAERDAAFDALNAAQAEKDSAESKKIRNENMIVGYKKNIEDLEFENRQLETTINANEDQMKVVLAPAYIKNDAALEGIQTEYEQSFKSLVEPRRLAHEKAIKEVTEAQQNLQKLAEQKKHAEDWLHLARLSHTTPEEEDYLERLMAETEAENEAAAALVMHFDEEDEENDEEEAVEEVIKDPIGHLRNGWSVHPKDCSIQQLHKLLRVRKISEFEGECHVHVVMWVLSFR